MKRDKQFARYEDDDDQQGAWLSRAALDGFILSAPIRHEATWVTVFNLRILSYFETSKLLRQCILAELPLAAFALAKGERISHLADAFADLRRSHRGDERVEGILLALAEPIGAAIAEEARQAGKHPSELYEPSPPPERMGSTASERMGIWLRGTPEFCGALAHAAGCATPAELSGNADPLANWSELLAQWRACDYSNPPAPPKDPAAGPQP